jgi:hypothetical protein
MIPEDEASPFPRQMAFISKRGSFLLQVKFFVTGSVFKFGNV